MKDAFAQPALAQWSGEKQPVDRVQDPGLGLAEQILTAPLVGAPERKAADVPLEGLKLQPGKHLIDEVFPIEPGVLIGKQDAPEREDQEHREQQRTAAAVR